MSTILPFLSAVRPKGEVEVFMPMREVGDIWPPVMPKTLLLMTSAKIFSLRMAQEMVDSMPMLYAEPSPGRAISRASGRARFTPAAVAMTRP